MAEPIYLDNSTTTRPSPEGVKAMLPFLDTRWGTPYAPHHFGQELHRPMKRAYQQIYALLRAEASDHFVFTSSGAEAVNHVIHGVYHDVAREEGKNHFVTSWADEAPAIMAIGRLEQMGAIGKMAEVDSTGEVTAKSIGEALTPRTALVSLSSANGLTGVIHPIEEIAAVCRERGVLLHIDVTHHLGKGFFDLEEFDADFVTFNGDHLHAPKGTGGLLIRKGNKLSSLIQGGMEQAGGRAGSLNLPALVALGVAAEELRGNEDFVAMEGARLRDKLESDIASGYPEAQPLFVESDRLPTVSCIAFPGVSSDALLYALNEEGVFASFGGGSFQRLSLLLQAAGVERALSHSAIGFSLSADTTEEQVHLAAERIVAVAQKLRKSSEALV